MPVMRDLPGMRCEPFRTGGAAAILERQRRVADSIHTALGPSSSGAAPAMTDETSGPDEAPIGRRAILTGLAAAGIGTATFRRALAAQAEQAGKVSPEMIKQSEWIAGLELSDKER